MCCFSASKRWMSLVFMLWFLDSGGSTFVSTAIEKEYKRGRTEQQMTTMDDGLFIYENNTSNPHNYHRRNQYINHERAIVRTLMYYEVRGVRGTISLWQPSVHGSDEFSQSKIAISSSREQFDEDYESIEVGWQIYPHKYGVPKAVLFVLWTVDGYRHICYNTDCNPGFVQEHPTIKVGQQIQMEPSIFNGRQNELDFFIYKRDAYSWGLNVNKENIGYWPTRLFRRLNDHASYASWGGDILNNSPSGHHTRTEMGSGHFAEAGAGKAAYVRNLMVSAGDDLYINVPLHELQILSDNRYCYNVAADARSSPSELKVYFGGPGYNGRHCP